jgi:hypothetical protein
VGAKECGELEKERRIGEDDLKVVSRKKLL